MIPPAPQVHKEGRLRALLCRSRKAAGISLPILAILLALAVAFGAVKLPWATPAAEKEAPPEKETLGVKLVAGNSLLVPEEVRKSLGIRQDGVDQIAVAEKPARTRPLVMPGSTALDPARLIRVRVRFAPADVVEIGKIDDPHGSPGNVPPLRRELQAGDPVKKGDLLAVLFSVDVGNKKNDLFDALSQLRLDEEVLKRAEARSASVPEVFILNARRNVQADINAVNRAENTLKTWAIPEEDIQAVRDEVQNASGGQDGHAKAKDRLRQWARVELKAPDDGFIIEQNVALHETVVDNTTNLFQLAKVDPLVVLAAVPEDDLPALQDLKSQTRDPIAWTLHTVGTRLIAGLVDDIGYLIDPNQHTAIVRGHNPNPKGLLRAGQFVTATVELLPPKNVVEVPITAVVLVVLAAVPEDDLPALQDLKSQTRNPIVWTVCTVGTQPIAGLVDDIGYLIDPNQHTAIVRGHIPNPKGLLRAGQFVRATVELLPPKNVVEVPISAVVEDGKDSIVFVQADPQKPVYTMRRVQVTNRFDRTAYVRSVPMSKDEQRAPDAEGQPSSPAEPLRAGERVLTAGTLELKAALASKVSEGARD